MGPTGGTRLRAHVVVDSRGPHLSCGTHLHPSSDIRDPRATWVRNLVPPVGPTCHAGPTCHVAPIFRRPGPTSHMGPQPCATHGPHLSCRTHLPRGTHLQMSGTHQPHGTQRAHRPRAYLGTNKVKLGKNNSIQESNLGRGYQHHISCPLDYNIFLGLLWFDTLLE